MLPLFCYIIYLDDDVATFLLHYLDEDVIIILLHYLSWWRCYHFFVAIIAFVCIKVNKYEMLI